jgi:hypothetical protein
MRLADWMESGPPPTDEVFCADVAAELRRLYWDELRVREHRDILAAEITKLHAEHAELLAAAKLTIDLYDSENDPSRTTFSEIVEMYCASDNALRAAIAKAGGKE